MSLFRLLFEIKHDFYNHTLFIRNKRKNVDIAYNLKRNETHFSVFHLNIPFIKCLSQMSTATTLEEDGGQIGPLPVINNHNKQPRCVQPFKRVSRETPTVLTIQEHSYQRSHQCVYKRSVFVAHNETHWQEFEHIQKDGILTRIEKQGKFILCNIKIK